MKSGAERGERDLGKHATPIGVIGPSEFISFPGYINELYINEYSINKTHLDTRSIKVPNRA
jgi:hypothetical protein